MMSNTDQLYPYVNNKLINSIQNTFPSKNKWEIYLKNNLVESLKHPSINNNFLLNFIKLFEPYYDDDTNDIIDNSIGKNFFKFIQLNLEQLNLLISSLEFLTQTLPKEEKELCEEELYRAKNDTTWIINEKKIYKLLFITFNSNNILPKNTIISNEMRGINLPQDNYFINLLSNKSWLDFDKNSITNFLKGLDFYYLSNEAYFFILPACIKETIDSFENQQSSLIEYLVIFLSDKNRLLYANKETKYFIREFIKLFSQLNFLQKIYFDDNLTFWFNID